MSYKFGKGKTQFKINKITECIQCGFDEDDKFINGLCYSCMCENDECIRCKKKRNHRGWGWKCADCLTEINQNKIHEHNIQVIESSKDKIIQKAKEDNKVKNIWPYACNFCKESKLSTEQIKALEEDYKFNSDPCSGCKNNYNFSKYI
jgi:hypothetical protein